jgi:iron complex outermembrane receptor protein
VNLSGAEFDNLDSDSWRIFLRWRPTENFSDDLIYNGSRSSSNGTASIIDAVRPGTPAARYPLPGFPVETGTGLINDLATQNALGPRTINEPAPFYGESNTINLITNTASYKFGSAAFKNITGVEMIDACASQPPLSVPTNYTLSTCFPNMYTTGGNLPTYPLSDFTQITNESNVSGTSFNDRLSWIGGVFVLWQVPRGGLDQFRADNIAKTSTTAVIDSIIQEDKSQALYAQGTYSITNSLKFTGGVRETWDERELQFGQLVSPMNGLQGTFHCASPGFGTTTPTDSCFNKFRGKYNGLGYTFDLEWQARENLLAYLATRRGWKAGGFNSQSSSANPRYNPEVLKDVEVGTKFDWSSENVKGHLNVDYYHSWYSQIQQQLTTIAAAGNGLVIVTNAGDAQISGAEMEASSTFYNRFYLSAF